MQLPGVTTVYQPGSGRLARVIALQEQSAHGCAGTRTTATGGNQKSPVTNTLCPLEKASMYLSVVLELASAKNVFGRITPKTGTTIP